MLTRNFAAANYAVALLDVLSDATAERYRAQLRDYEPRIILLMASLEIIRPRTTEWGMRLTKDEITMLYTPAAASRRIRCAHRNDWPFQ